MKLTVGFFTLVASIFTLTTRVICAPQAGESFKIEDPKAKPEHVTHSKAAYTELQSMLSQLSASDPKQKATGIILEHGYGPDWDKFLNEHKRHITDVMVFKFTIRSLGKETTSPDTVAQWDYGASKMDIYLPSFSFGTDKAGIRWSALALAHELAHAAFGAFDRFTKAGWVGVRKNDPRAANSWVGYLKHDFRYIRNNRGGSALIVNADSLMLMLHIKANGLTDLFNGKIKRDLWILKSTDNLKEKRKPASGGEPALKKVKTK